jgi:hypothetical protein
MLYKYFPLKRVSIIPDLQIGFSPPSEFNDAFDTYHLLPAASAPKVKIARSRLRFDLGVFCLAEQADNHLMWVNYASSHTGFVLGFRTDTQFFEENGRTLRKVIYQKRPPLFSTPDENGCFYKAPDWEYEQEWRCVRSFGKSESRLVEIDPSLVTEVIFGHLMEAGERAKIIWFAKLLEMNPLFFVSSPSNSDWKFVNRPKTVTPCEHCFGQGFVMEDQ